MPELKKYQKPEYFTNRELSWLLFDKRVLGEAEDQSNPLFERLKFLSITASNLDEFFMVRVASLKDMENAGYTKRDIAGMTPTEQLKELHKEIHGFVEEQYRIFNGQLMPECDKIGFHIVRDLSLLSEKELLFVDKYFDETVYPVLTPMAVDSSRPFPLVRNKTLNLAALLSKKSKPKELEFAMVQVPSVLPRLVEIPTKTVEETKVVLLEDVIDRNIDKLFLSYDLVSSAPFRIMRNADLTIEEEEAEDLLKEIEKQIKKRQWGQAIRLEIGASMDEALLKRLKEELHIQKESIFAIDGPLDLTFLMKAYGLPGFEKYKTAPFTPQPVPGLSGEYDIFEKIKQGDILMHHPYQSFQPVVDFIKTAARDPKVLAIKQTLYRVSGNSPIIAALAQAAENGKQVSVLVELKARFDEENNIGWAKMLEKAGCHVIYGLVGLKTHCKITLVVRKEEEGIRRYVHLATGNYNDATAKLYTDMGIFTCAEPYGEDATAVFNMLSGYSEPKSWNKLSLAPLWLKDKFLYMIEREKKLALDGRGGRIIAKMNSLCDPDIIAALYDASAAGVSIDLIVRGICCLKVGIPKISENIRVRSLVGTYLEHIRIFYFENGGNSEVYLASADWMPRNLERRVEILFPVEEPASKEYIEHVLDWQLKDNVKARELQADGSYVKASRTGRAFQAQASFCKEVMNQTKAIKALKKRVFTPETNKEESK